MTEARKVLRGRWIVIGERRDWNVVPGGDREIRWPYFDLLEAVRRSTISGRPIGFRDRGSAIQWIIRLEKEAVSNCGDYENLGGYSGRDFPSLKN